MSQTNIHTYIYLSMDPTPRDVVCIMCIIFAFIAFFLLSLFSK